MEILNNKGKHEPHRRQAYQLDAGMQWKSPIACKMKKATKQKQSSRQNGERDQLIVKFVKQWSEFPK